MPCQAVPRRHVAFLNQETTTTERFKFLSESRASVPLSRLGPVPLLLPYTRHSMSHSLILSERGTGKEPTYSAHESCSFESRESTQMLVSRI